MMPLVQPFGLKPISQTKSTVFKMPVRKVLESNMGPLFSGDAVYINESEQIKVSEPTGSNSSLCLGSFQGIEFTNANNSRIVSNLFNINLIPKDNLDAQDVWFWIDCAENYESTFEIKILGNHDERSIGKIYGYEQNPSNPNPINCFSTGHLSQEFATYNDTGAFKIVGISPNNSDKDSFTRVIVTLTNPQLIP